MPVIRTEQLATLLFGQQHLMTEFYFTSQFGQYHTINLHQLPHVKCLTSKTAQISNDAAYLDYLSVSWDYYRGVDGNTPDVRLRRLDAYRSLSADVSARVHLREEAIREPITVCRRPDGRFVIVDGNHRAAIAMALNLDVPAVVVPLTEQLSRVVRVPDEFYGTQRLRLPYQGVYHRGTLLVRGRRPDIVERFNRIDPTDVKGKSVLDLGCNIGMNCYLAVERGAVAALGIEASPAIASAAIRLNAYFASPCFFITHDLNEAITYLPRFDTAFCFSLLDHVQTKEGIIETIRRTVEKVLYLEGHAGSKREDYAYLLNNELFSEVDLLGYGHDGIHVDDSTRPLFRCEVRRTANGCRGSPVGQAGLPAELFRVGGDAWQDALGRLKAQSHPTTDSTVQEVEAVVPFTEDFILVDDDHLRCLLNQNRKAIPFLERDGEYWGPPEDDATAVRELERLRRQGATFIVFAWPAFWWLDYYSELQEYLRSKFRCAAENDRLIAFDLRA